MAVDYGAAYTSALQQANAANEGRYQTILAGYNARQSAFANTTANIKSDYNSLLAKQEQWGDSLNTDIADQYTRATDTTRASMIGRGLYNSTLLDNMQRGNESDLARSKERVKDMMIEKYANIFLQRLGFQERAELFGQAGLSKDKFDFMERREDIPPDPGFYVAMAQLQAASEASQNNGQFGFPGGGFTSSGMGSGGGGASARPPVFRDPYWMTPKIGLNPGGVEFNSAMMENAYNQAIWNGAGRAAMQQSPFPIFNGGFQTAGSGGGGIFSRAGAQFPGVGQSPMQQMPFNNGPAQNPLIFPGQENYPYQDFNGPYGSPVTPYSTYSEGPSGGTGVIGSGYNNIYDFDPE